MKVILDEKLYDEIWNRIEKEYKFYPSINRKINSFEFNIENICYQLNSYWSAEQEKIVNDIFKKIGNDDLYALDWSYGMFGHPWRNEIYIFGRKIINEFKNKEKELNITKL